jgi:glycerol-3-phosphate acyltransferase PlsX
LRIGVDLMGSDSSPQVLYQGVLEAVDKLREEDSLLVFSTQTYLPEHPRIAFQIASEIISMDDDPLSSIRLKKDSSLVMGIRFLKENKIDAFVSAGNTGALVGLSALTLPVFPGIERPALLALLPTKKGPFAMVDVGGAPTIKAKNLVQYANMGAAFQRCLFGIEEPTIALLNIGTESKKGTPEVREAYNILKEMSQNPEAKIKFVGNVEGREVFEGNIDVLVTDGFTGNVMLKTSEGISELIFDYLSASSRELEEEIDDLRRHFSYDEYPGAIVCGIDAIVMKCHGEASARAMMNSILGTSVLVHNSLPTKIKQEL